MVQTVKQFISDAYQLISANSPTVPLQGNDMLKGVQFMNELLAFFSATGLMLTIAKQVDYTLPIGQRIITFGAATVTPTPDVTVGRLANNENSWLTLDGVEYPLIDISRNVFNASYKYIPQQGLPRFIIITNNVETTSMRFYPAASQVYDVSTYGKFELPPFAENGTMADLPLYYQRYFRLAVAKDLAMYKGRSQAWTPRLEEMLGAAEDVMQATSSFNLTIDTGNESYLNGSWRVKAGI